MYKAKISLREKTKTTDINEPTNQNCDSAEVNYCSNVSSRHVKKREK
jgi:hypothetical protein